MSTTRVTGIVSNFDTETLVKDMMKAEKAKYEKIDKEKQYLEWQQEEYRDIISTLSSFQSSYFDVANSETNIKSASSFAKFSSSVTVGGVANNAISVSANSDIINFEHEITSITSLATKDTWNGSETYLSSIKSSGVDTAALSNLKSNGLEFSLSIDGSAKILELTKEELETASGGDDLSIDELVGALNAKISELFGEDFDGIVEKINVDGNDEIKFDFPGNSITILDSGDLGTVGTLGIESGSSNYDYSSKTIGEALGINEDDLDNLSINGVKITGLTTDDTIKSMMSKINAFAIDAKLSYSSIEDKFVLQSKSEGSLNNIDLDTQDSVDFFAKLSIQDGENRESAKNAKLIIDNKEIVKSSNTFTLDGVTYNINEEYSGEPLNVKFTQDTAKISSFIKDFVGKYNELITDLNGRISEERDYDYEPLTEDEKEGLTDEEIEKWEAKAKKGLFRRDSTISNLLTKMRQSLYETVENAGLNLKDMGITATKNYLQKGKLEIDDVALTEAINNNYSEVIKLFTSESDKKYLDDENKTERYNENGIANRLNDLIQDHVRITRDKDNRKGIFIEKAGKEGDVSFLNSTLTEKIAEYDTRIDEALDYLADKEEYYYTMFAKMETALSRMDSQMSWFSQQMGTS